MKVVALTCPQCGGGQDVTDERPLVECRYCRTTLRVERSATGELERLLSYAQEESAELAFENRKLRLQNEIHRLDGAWEARRQSLLITTKHGTREPSSLWGSVVAFIGGCLFLAGFLTLFMAGSPQIVQFALLGFGAVVTIGGISEQGAGRRFERERADYKRNRAQLEKRLGELEYHSSPELSYEDTKRRRERLDRMSYPAADA